MAFSGDGQRMAITTCFRCQGGEVPPTGTQLHLSDDGGTSWRLAREFDDGSRVLYTGFVDSELVMWTRSEQSGNRFWLYPSGDDIPVPAGAGLLVDAGPPMLWTSEAGLITDSGDLFLATGEDGIVPGSYVRGQESFAFAWIIDVVPNRSWAISTVSPSGEVGPAFRIDVDHLNPEIWPADTGVIVGAVLPGAPWNRPAIIDVHEGTISWIEGPWDSLQYRDLEAYPLALLQGPLARVVDPGTCLDVRAEPDTSAALLGCYVDGVLLRTTGQTTDANGRTWLAVTTPTGAPGWADTEGLEW